MLSPFTLLYFETQESPTDNTACLTQYKNTHPSADQTESLLLQCWDQSENIEHLIVNKTWHYQKNPKGGDNKCAL